MAVSILNDWTGFTNGDPDGASLTIGSSADRVLEVVYLAERAAGLTYTSITVGGQSPTGEKIAESSTTSVSAEQFLWAWYWDETAIAAMSASATVVFNKTGSPVSSAEAWDYIVFAGVTGGAEFGDVVEDTAPNTVVSTPSESGVNDWITVAINRSSPNRDVTAYDNLTEGWQYNGNFTAAVADGQGGDDAVALTGDGLSGDWQVVLLLLKAAAAAGGAMSIHQHIAMLSK